MRTRSGLDPELGHWSGIRQQPIQRFAHFSGAGLARQIPIRVFDGRLQAIQRSKEILESQPVDDHIVVA